MLFRASVNGALPEKALARSNALKSLDADRYPRIRLRANDIDKTGDGYRLSGVLEVHGTARLRVSDLRVEELGDCWRISCEAEVRQSESGVNSHSMLMVIPFWGCVWVSWRNAKLAGAPLALGQMTR